MTNGWRALLRFRRVDRDHEEGFTEVALGLAGAKDIKVRADAPVPDGARDGAVTVTLRLEMTWSE